MSNEILSVLQFMEKEKGIKREDMISAIVSAVKNAAQKGVNAGQELKVEIDAKTGLLKAWALITVVDFVANPAQEIHIEKAKKLDPGVQIGDVVQNEIDPAYLGRIAAQTARQAIMQKMRQFEKDRIYDDYKSSIGDIVSGTVRRRDKGSLTIDLGKVEAILPAREQIPGETYAPGERIRCLLLSIDSTSRGPELILSRSNIKFVQRLFELEVTEIADGTIVIEKIVREPGYRTKMCVQTSDPKVDPVGACVGARGARVKAIVRELGGEKIDIIRYFSNPLQMLEEAVKPAVPKNVQINEAERSVSFEVPPADLSIVIGRGGINAKLTSKILGWRLNIAKEEGDDKGFQHRMQRAIEGIHQIPGITDAQAQQLVNSGITTPEAFEGVTASDLEGLGFSEVEAKKIIEKVALFQKQ